MDIFRQLTRGVHFNTSKFKDDAKKFGLKSSHEEKFSSAIPSERSLLSLDILDTPTSTPPASASSSPTRDEPESESESDDGGELTLLGDIKVKTKNKSKKERKRTKTKTMERMHQLAIEKTNHFRNLHRIHVQGTDLPTPIDTWERLKSKFGLSDELCAAIIRRYQQGPTPIQMQAIPFLLAHREVLACAPTGSGKTAAYIIPLLHMLSSSKAAKITGEKKPRALILAPTRELAMQILAEVVALGEGLKLKASVLDGNVEKKKKIADIIVSTPNRMVYLLKQSPEYLNSAEYLIVDESDKLFEAGVTGFRDQLAIVYSACPPTVQRGMFSATLATDVEQWCKLNLDNPVSVTIGARNTATEQVRQELIYTGTEKGKLLAFKDIVDRGLKPPVLVFVQTKERAKDLHAELQTSIYGGLKVDVIHSGRSELQRDMAVRNFRSGRIWVLICTELLGRGIDFKGVNLVVNYDFPPSTISYIHRIGRTGRAGRSGHAVTFFTDTDKTLLRSIAQLVKSSGGEVPEYMLKLKKASRQDKRKLAKKAVAREGIREESKYDKEKRIMREQMVEASKKRKRGEDGLSQNKEGATGTKKPRTGESVSKANKAKDGKKKRKKKQQE